VAAERGRGHGRPVRRNRKAAQAADEKGYDSDDVFVDHSELDSEVDLKGYSVSNRGLRPALVLIQCSPMPEEGRRIGRDVLPRLEDATA
jgi:FMNH2-dependent dimethyl sulfone monooxygenase